MKSKIKTYVGVILLLIIGILFLNACDGGETNHALDSSTAKIIVLLPGSAEDQSWNNSNVKGIQSYNERQNFEISYEEEIKENDFQSRLAAYGEQGYELVIASGSQFDDAVAAVASDYPDTLYLVINGSIGDAENVAAVVIKEYEAAYLASVIAGITTETGIFGMIAGYPNTSMDQLMDVFQYNATTLAKERGLEDTRALRSYANSWTDIKLGQLMSEQMIDSGADTLFIYANQISLGCIEAAEQGGARVIGFSDDQNALSDSVVASVIFDFDYLYSWIFDQYESGHLKGNKAYEIGISEGLFDVVYSDEIEEDVIQAVEKAKDDVFYGRVDLEEWFQ